MIHAYWENLVRNLEEIVDNTATTMLLAQKETLVKQLKEALERHINKTGGPSDSLWDCVAAVIKTQPLGVNAKSCLAEKVIRAAMPVVAAVHRDPNRIRGKTAGM